MTDAPTTAKSGMADIEAHDLEKTANGEAHELPEGSVAFVGVEADRRVYIA